MRPIKMTMKGFCSYAEKTEIDFTKPHQNLFLITGDTGSGKTTIFDALVFALYGKSSALNDGKSGTEFQSDFTSYSIEPFVELIFSEQKGKKNQNYKIKRIPRHNTYKKGGKELKKTAENETVYLSLLNDDGEESVTGNLSTINDKIKEIVGLTKEQFMQLSMIAQGEFMEVLKGKDKQEIFRKLFSTDIYKELTDKVKELAKEKKNEVDMITERFKVIVNKIKSENLTANNENEEISDLDKILNDNTLIDNSIISKSIKNLEKRYRSVVKESEIITKDEKALFSLRDKKNEELSKAEELEIKFKKYKSALENDKKYAELLPEMAKNRDILGKLEKYYAVKTLFERFNDIRLTVDKKTEELTQNEALLPDYKIKQDKLINKEKIAKEELNNEIARLSEISQNVSDELENIEKIKIIKKEKNRLSDEQKKLKENEKDIKKSLKKFDEDEKRLKKEADLLRKLEPELVKIDNKKSLAINFLNEVPPLMNVEGELISLSKEIENAELLHKEKEEEYLNKNNEYTRVQTLFWGNQAGIVASKLLKKGKPCPVCGSLDHPKPCEIDLSEEKVTNEILNNMEGELNFLKDKLDKTSKELGARKAGFSEKRDNFNQNKEKLTDNLSKEPFNFAADLPLSIIKFKIECLIRVYDMQRAEVGEGLKRLSNIEGYLKELENKRNRLKKDEEVAKNKSTEISEKLAGVISVINSLEASKKFKSEKVAIDTRNKAESSKLKSEELYDKLKEECTTAITEREKIETTVKNLRNELPDFKNELSDKKAKYIEELKKLNIDESTWQNFTQTHALSEKEKIRKILERFDKEKAINDSELKTIKLEIGDKAQPDILLLREEFNKITDKYNEVRKRSSQLNTLVSGVRTLLNEFNDLERDSKKIFKEYNTVNNLCNKLTGKVKGRKVDIETFAQRYYLESILTEANKRFNRMTEGQFTLELYDIDEAGDGKNRGLDLRVHCNITGKDRDVRTLSGGESFMAALSLALGMADKIQERVGAINLDIMFVDEGFGTLDDNSRNEAIKLLKNLAGGSKLIGIISHVSELKSEIDEQLIVTKNERGSSVAWVTD